MTPVYYEIHATFLTRVRPPYGFAKVFDQREYTMSLSAATGLTIVLRTECVENLALILKKLDRWTSEITESRICAVERKTVTETITHEKLIERKLTDEETWAAFGPAVDVAVFDQVHSLRSEKDANWVDKAEGL